jgi:hypothetical protein
LNFEPGTLNAAKRPILNFEPGILNLEHHEAVNLSGTRHTAKTILARMTRMARQNLPASPAFQVPGSKFQITGQSPLPASPAFQVPGSKFQIAGGKYLVVNLES